MSFLSSLGNAITSVSDLVCGYPLFIALIGGGLFLLITSKMVSIRHLPHAIQILRQSKPHPDGKSISSAQALASAVAATIGMGNIAGVAIAITMGGPGAIFWMWVSALVGMSTKYHEGVLAIKYRNTSNNGQPLGGPMHIIRHALPHRWHPLATVFALSGMLGTLCIMNANQLTEAVTATAAHFTTINNPLTVKLIIGIAISAIVAAVTIGGIRRIATVASYMVPFMVGIYMLMVLYIVVTNIDLVPSVFKSIFSQAFSLKAGWGALIGIALIGARRAALVNDAGVGTASIMHSTSANNVPVKEGLIAMLGPAIDSGFVCTLSALAILLCGQIPPPGTDAKGLEIALHAFGQGIPSGQYLLMVVVACFALSSMFSYSFYGATCAHYLFGPKGQRLYVWFFIISLTLFAVVPLTTAVALCDLFYALMAFPTMIMLIKLRKQVHAETRNYFSSQQPNQAQTINDASLKILD